MKIWVLLASLMMAVQANAAILSLTIPGSVTGSLSNESGWLDGDTSAIDFYTFELTSDTELSFFADTDFTSMGLSLYAGEIMMDPGFLFNNAGDFFDFAGESLTYLTGTSAFVPGVGDNALQAGVMERGQYTLAVGGNEGFSFGAFDYTLNATAVSAAVSEPSTFGIALLMLSGLYCSRRDRR
ncbi:hypothetical protein HHX48_05630 [Salinimonas sp. HHU 13199]|uniref:PEP-CTERM protein-sorting domain-containing protein n=1 Tax=Salinimonas profundi TaxID=2729140 RepID=A0ABR8LJ00_9ALTE|nr:hypothetical protein [Salinimonas profundi]MBD3585208.1 hypothetical protein [Salinimonas profundi]